MYVIQLLPHDVLILNLLRMTSFLPKLVFTIRFEMGFVLRQLFKKHPFPAALQRINDSPGRERLEVADLFTEIICRSNK